MSKEEKLKILFRENYHALVFFAFKMLDSKAEAEDVVQDAFVNYWNQQSKVSEEAVKSYLYTTVRNSSLNVLRSRLVAMRHEQEAVGEQSRTILEQLLEAETMAIVHKAIATLPPVCQQIARLSHFEGKRNEEIAVELGISVNSVKTHKQRALQLLRKKLSPELLALVPLLL